MLALLLLRSLRSGRPPLTLACRPMAAPGRKSDFHSVGLKVWWHENGQQQAEVAYKDGEEVSAKYWNSKGEEVDSLEQSEN